MQGFFTFLAQNPISAAVLRRRARRLDRASQHQGVWPRHGCRRHRGGRGPFGLGVDLRREARAEQVRQEPVLLPVHVRRRAARRTVLHQQPEGRWPQVRILALVSSVLGLALVVIGAKLFALPIGAAGGMLAGSQTMSAAIGSAEQAITSGVVKLPEGMKPEDASGMIALSYGITYIWGTVGIILICKYLPRWWGVDAKAAAEAVRGGVRCQGSRRRRPYRLSAVRPARLPAGESGAGRHEHRRASAQSIPNIASSTSCVAVNR